LKKQTIGALALLISLSISAPTFAASTDFTHNGDGYTTDAISGLDWLDLSQTLGQSYNEVAIQLDDNTSDLYGWRYATGDEFTLLHKNYTGDTGVADVSTYTDKVDYDSGVLLGLIALLGDTAALWTAQNDTTINDLYSLDGVNSRTFGLLESSKYDRMAIANLWNWDDNLDYSAAIHDKYNSDLSRLSSRGSFLVRQSSGAPLIATPIPAALFMFAPALLGFIGLRRKLKA